jgi:hypothetical protein
MSLYWQHVGDELAKRDIPRTVGSLANGLRKFSRNDVAAVFDNSEDSSDVAVFLREIDYNTGFPCQIWGVPEGARNVLAHLSPGDWFLLLDTDGGGGSFHYVGKIVARFRGQAFSTSHRLWGEAKYPLVFALNGYLLDGFYFEEFKNSLKYGAGLKGMGRCHKVADKAIQKSGSVDTDEFVQNLISRYA